MKKINLIEHVDFEGILDDNDEGFQVLSSRNYGKAIKRLHDKQCEIIDRLNKQLFKI